MIVNHAIGGEMLLSVRARRVFSVTTMQGRWWTVPLCAVLVALSCVSSSQPACAQKAAADDTQAPPIAQESSSAASNVNVGVVSPPVDAEETAPEAETIHFNFKNTPYAEVIDFFSRAADLPVINEVDPPKGALTYFAPEPYSLDDALRILNIILQTREVTLRRDGQFLYLGKFDKTNIGSMYSDGQVPGSVTDDQLVTVLIPLENITAKEVSERLSPLVGKYGNMVALPAQNRLLLTETAGQARRLQQLISTLDTSGDFQDQVRIFPLQYAKAKALSATLKILMSERVVKYVINQQGQQVKLEEDNLAGLRLQSDERTNTIIAKGPLARLETLEEMIAMLDHPGQDVMGGSEMTTFKLQEIDAAHATKLLNELFRNAKKESKPTILALPDVNKVTVVGSSVAIMQSLALLDEVDGGGAANDGAMDDSRSTAVISINESNPKTVQDALDAIMTPRQKRLVKIISSGNNRSLILAGPAGDVAVVRNLVETLDLPSAFKPKEVRLMHLAKGDPAAILKRTSNLYTKQVDTLDPDYFIDVELDTESNVVTLIGQRTAIDRWGKILQSVESAIHILRETRQIKLLHASPSMLIRPLNSLTQQLLQPTDGTTFVKPEFVPIDELETLLVTCPPTQWSTIESLITTLDKESPRDIQFQIIRIVNQDAHEVSIRAMELYKAQTATLDPGRYGEIDVQVDDDSGSLMLTGAPQGITKYLSIVNQLRQLTPAARTTRFIELKQTSVADVLPPLEMYLASADPIEQSRTVPSPSFTVIESMNGMLVTAEAAQHRLIDDVLRRLDVAEPTALAPLRLLQLRAADVTSIGQMLTKQYQGRSAEERRLRPVQVQSDPATNTLIVSAHESVFGEIKDFVDQLNAESTKNADRVTEIFPLKSAQAVELAKAMNLLYPEPPVPLDRRGRPMVWAREPREVQIGFDAGTNSIIVDAPAERIPAFKALVEKLDRIELPPLAEIRTFPIQNADIKTIEKTLNDLARSGSLSAPSEAGKPSVKVTITAEPVSHTLIVTGDDTTFERVEELLTRFEAVPVERELRIIAIANADPSDVRDQALNLYEQQSEGIPDAPVIEVEVDNNSNALMVVAEKEGMVRFLGIIDKLQESYGPGMEVELIALSHANAEDVVVFLRDLSTSSRSFQTGAGGSAPTFEPISRTNSILIAAHTLQLQLIRSLVRELDVLETTELPPVRMLQLETADAANLATVLNGVYAARSAELRTTEPVSILSDGATNTLLVSAHPTPFAEIQQIVQELNESNLRTTTGREIRIFPLTVARAEELAKTLDQMFPDPPVPVDRRGRPLNYLRPQREVVVRADIHTNSIIVDAPVERMAGFEELVKQLDATEITANTEVRTYSVQNADLAAVQSTLQELVKSGALLPGNGSQNVRLASISISVEPTSRTLIVAGPTGVFEQIDRVLKEIDAAPEKPTTVMRFFTLEHARSDRLVPLLQQLLVSRLEQEIEAPNVQVDSLLNVTHDPKSNVLIISAPEIIMPIAEELIRQLDTSTARVSDPVIRIHPLTFANAEEVAQTLGQTLPQMLNRTTREPLSARIIAAVGSNAVVMIGAEDELAQIEELITPLDSRPSIDAVVAETVQLENAVATELAPIVERMLNSQQEVDPRLLWRNFRNVRGTPAAQTPKVHVEADARTNALIVSASQASIALARTLIEQLDRPLDENDRSTELFRPHNAHVTQLVSTVTRMIVLAGNEERIDLIADVPSGTIIAIGDTANVQSTMTTLRTFDEQTPQLPAMDMQVLTVVNADASAVAKMMTILLRDRSGWPIDLQAAVQAGIVVAQPTATADKTMNRIVVSAPRSLMPIARNVLEQLDQVPSDEVTRELSIFNLTQADAVGVAKSIQDLMLQQGVKHGNDDARKPYVSAEPSTNSILVSATPEVMAEVSTLVESLDAGIAADRIQVRTVFLQHARAERVAPIVEQLLKGERVDSWIRYDAMRRGSQLPDMGPDVRVASESRLNAIVVSAPASVLGVAEEMIHQLDVDPSASSSTGQRAVQVIPLHNTSAQEMAASLSALFTDEDIAADDVVPVIRVEQASNALIVRATPEQFEMIRGLIEEIEKAALTGARQMEVISLDRGRADAAETANTIKRLLEQRSGSKVRIITIDELLKQRVESENDIADESNAGESKEGADDERLGGGVLLPARVRLLTEIASSGLAVFEEPENLNPPGDEDDDSADVVIAVDRETNSLIVVGSPFAAQRAAELARTIQEQVPALPGSVHYIQLDSQIDPSQVANVVNSTINQLRRQDARAFGGPISVVGDRVGGGLIVSANPNDFEILGTLIAAICEPTDASQIAIKIFPLHSINATRAEQTLTSMFGSDPRRRGRQSQQVRNRFVEMNGQSVAIDPQEIRLTPTPNNDAIIVAAPEKAFPIIEQFLSLIDQMPVADAALVQHFPLENADAAQVRQTLQQLFDGQYRMQRQQAGNQVVLLRATIAADSRTNSLIVSGTARQFEEVARLLATLDVPTIDESLPLTILTIESALPSRIVKMVNAIVIGSDKGRREQIVVVPDDTSRTLLVRAPADDLATIRRIIAEVDQSEAKEFPVRSIKLERADAERVAQGLQRFFEDRARISQRPGQSAPRRRVSIVGDKRSSTLVVASSDEDFVELERLAALFDVPSDAESLKFDIILLKHAKAADVTVIVQSLGWELTYDSSAGRYGGRSNERGRLSVQSDERTNAIILSGSGENFDLVENIIHALDVPAEHTTARSVRVIKIEHGDTNLIARAVTDAFAGNDQPWWWFNETSTDQLKVIADRANKMLVISGEEDELLDVEAFVKAMDDAAQRPSQRIEIVTVEHGRATEIARDLSRFFRDRARSANLQDPGVTITPANTANKLVISADEERMLLIRDLLTQLDIPADGDDRTVRLLALVNGKAADTVRTLQQLFPTRNVNPDQRVVTTADARTNSIVVSAPIDKMQEIESLMAMIDAPAAGRTKIVRTYTLQNARAVEAASLINQTLGLETVGRSNRSRRSNDDVTRVIIDDPQAPKARDDHTEGVEIIATVTPNERTNSLIVVATPESLPALTQMIQEMDEAPVISVRDFKTYALEHAIATEVRTTLSALLTQRSTRSGRGSGGITQDPPPTLSSSRRDNTLIVAATTDQHQEIADLLKMIDVPSRAIRITEFVALEYAEASKVSEALDVFYGRYAFEADSPSKRNVSIVADPASNSLVISAEEVEWPGIREIIEKLDAEEYDSSLRLEVIALQYADAASVASAINGAFAADISQQAGNQKRQNGRGNDNGEDREAPRILVESSDVVRASPEEMTNSIIVSASNRNLTKIKAIVTQLDVADFARLPAPQLIAIQDADAMELAETLRTMYTQMAGSNGKGRASRGAKSVVIIGDKTSNTIIVRADNEEFQQIASLARAIEQTSGQSGVMVRVLALENAMANRVASALSQAFEETARDSGEPFTVQVDPASNSLVVASSSRLFQQIERVAAELDQLGPGGERQIYIVPVENVSPAEMKRILEELEMNRERGDTSGILAEPITITLLSGRRALAILANPVDRERIVTIVASLDKMPASNGQDVRIVELKRASADAIVSTIRDLLKPADQHADTPLAHAVQEQIRRLNIQRGGLGKSALQLNLDDPVRVTAAPTLNAIIISSTPDNCDSLVEIASIFDRVPITESVVMRLFPLSNISARQMMSLARELFTQGNKLRTLSGSKVAGQPASEVGAALIDDVTLAIDERTNTLIAAGREPAVALVEVLVAKLDQELAAKWVEPRLIALDHADANELAQMINTVLVQGQANNTQAGALQNQYGRLRILRRGKQDRWLPSNDQNAQSNTYIDADIFVPMTRLVVHAESQLNALVVVGTPENLEVVQELVAMLDVPAASPSSAVRIFPLVNASAGRVASIVRNLFDEQVRSKAIRPEDKLVVEADERTNSIIVTTSVRSFVVLESLLGSLDSKSNGVLHDIQTIHLENSSAAQIAPNVQRLMDARVSRMRQYAPEAADLEEVTVIADSRSNMLLVSAGKEAFRVVERIAQSLDAGVASIAGTIEVIPLQTTNIDEVAQTIERIMRRQYADLPPDLAARELPLVMTDSRSNSLLVAANEGDLGRIRDLVATLEKTPINPAVAVHVIPLTDNSAATLAPRLQRLMDQRARSLGDSATPQDATTIQPDILTNSLLVVASDENLGVLQDLITALQQAESDAVAGEITEIITLENARADRMLGLVDELYIRGVNRVQGEGTLRVTADDRLNALVVSGPQGDIDAVRSLIAQLEDAQVADIREIEIIPLKAANAVEMVSLVENILGNGRAGRRDIQSTIMRLNNSDFPSSEDDDPDPDVGEGTQLSLAIREAIRLTPDLRTNAIIVSAPAESLSMIRDLITQLDSAESGSKRVRIFELTNADALQMATILADLFNLRQQNNMYVLRPRADDGSVQITDNDIQNGGAPRGEIFSSLADTDLITVPDERQQLSITIDPRTNSLLVSATPTYLDLVEEVILELDQKEGATREEFVVPLRNALALDVATALDTFLTQEQQRILETLGPDRAGSLIQQLEREVSVVGVQDSNTLLVSASPRYVDRVMNLIAELDKTPPQVLVSVMLAEVTLDSTEEWGTLWNVGPTGSRNFEFQSGGGVIGAALSGLGVPNLSVSTDDFDFLIRALEEQGRLEVLSRPQILVNNNQSAQFQVGQDITLPSDVQVTESGNTRSSTERESIGIILDVTPTISPDHFVRMDIEPEISSLSSETTQISEDFQAPIIDRRRVKTVVTIKDGQSVVIGGLFSTRSDLRKTKVPLLGDIPFFGDLFRSKMHRREKTELLVVITPHVVTSPEDAAKLTDQEIINMTLPRKFENQLINGAIDPETSMFKDDDHWMNSLTEEEALEGDKGDKGDKGDNGSKEDENDDLAKDQKAVLEDDPLFKPDPKKE